MQVQVQVQVLGPPGTGDTSCTPRGSWSSCDSRLDPLAAQIFFCFTNIFLFYKYFFVSTIYKYFQVEQLGNMMASRQLEAAPTSLSVYHQRVEQLELEREELEAMVGGGIWGANIFWSHQIFSG